MSDADDETPLAEEEEVDEEEEDIEEESSNSEECSESDAKRCIYCTEDRPHPMFVFLAAVESKQESQKSIAAKISLSRNPMKRVCEYNQIPGFKHFTKTTRKGSPNWHCEVCVGPFFGPGDATRFAAQWRIKRKSDRRMAYAVSLAQTKEFRHLPLRVWARDPSDLLEKVHVLFPDARAHVE